MQHIASREERLDLVDQSLFEALNIYHTSST